MDEGYAIRIPLFFDPEDGLLPRPARASAAVSSYISSKISSYSSLLFSAAIAYPKTGSNSGGSGCGRLATRLLRTGMTARVESADDTLAAESK